MHKIKVFTLIELLVVVLIIGILAAIALPQYERAVEKSRSTEALQNASALQRAIDMYLLESGYPDTNTNINFLGNNGEAKDVLNIDITSGMNCSVAEGHECSNQYFAYRAACNKSFCEINACRLVEGQNSCFASDYEFKLTKQKATDRWDKECQYSDDTIEYICKGVESLGFTRTSC